MLGLVVLILLLLFGGLWFFLFGFYCLYVFDFFTRKGYSIEPWLVILELSL